MVIQEDSSRQHISLEKWKAIKEPNKHEIQHCVQSISPWEIRFVLSSTKFLLYLSYQGLCSSLEIMQRCEPLIS